MGSNNGIHTEGSEHLTPLQRTGNEIAAFSVGEIIAEGTWLGVAGIIGMLPKSWVDNAGHAVGQTMVKPVLHPMEKLISSLCKLEECQIDYSKPEDQRADDLGRAVVMFVPAMAASVWVKLMSRRWVNEEIFKMKEDHPPTPKGMWNKVKHFGTMRNFSPQERMIFLADEGTHLGAMYVMNNQMAPVTDDIIKTSASILEKTTGMSHQSAIGVGTGIGMWMVPNVIAAGAAAGAISARHFLDWPKGPIGKLFGRVMDNASNGHQL